MEEPIKSVTPTKESIEVQPVVQTRKMNPQRRTEIFKVLRRSIKQIARERKAALVKNADYAMLCVLDAFQGRLSNGLANNSKKSKWIYTIFCIQTSNYMFKSVVIASVLHTFSIFFEPANACTNSILFKLFQWTVLLIYAVDIGLKMGYEGVHEYFRHDWQQLYATNLVLGVLDLLFCGCTLYTNPLRPLAGVLRARRGRKFFEILKKMIPEMIDNLIPVMFFVVIVMVFCSIFFDTQVSEFKSTAYTFYNWLFLVLTNDTFDRLLPEMLFLNLTYLMFFFPCIYVGQRFLFNLIIGDTYETFRSYVKKQLKKEKLKELQGLTKAFSVLDVDKRGSITDVQWSALITRLYPELSEEVLALYYELLSGGNPNITILQFLSLRSVLSFNLSYSKESKNFLLSKIQKIYRDGLESYNNLLIPMTPKLETISEKVFEIAEKYSIWQRVNQLDLVVLSLEFSNYPLITFREKVFLTLCQLILGIHLFEFICHLSKEKGKISNVSKDLNFVSTIFVLGCIGCFIYYLITTMFFWIFTNEILYEKSIFISPFFHFQITPNKLLILFRLLRCVRLANYSEELKDFNAALLDILPSLSETFVFTFIVSYMFGTLGHLIFGNYLEVWGTPLLSIVKAQQLTFMVSFLSSMEEAMAVVHPIISVGYFVIFLISSLTVSNVALSIIIDLHSNVLDMKSKKERDSTKKRLDLLFAKIVDQARCRRIFRSDLPPLNFRNIKLSAFQTSDVRHFIASDHNANKQYSFNLDELQSCQKYSNIDLMKFYNEQHRIHKDVNWEVNFVKSLHDLNIHEEKIYSKGDLIFEENQSANKLYLMVTGGALLRRSIKDQECIIFATKFMGSESLLPRQSYSFTSYCQEDNTKVMIFQQEDIIHEVEPDLLGSIMQMAFKTTIEIENQFTEKNNRVLLRRMSTNRAINVISTEEDDHSNNISARNSITGSPAIGLGSQSISPIIVRSDPPLVPSEENSSK